MVCLDYGELIKQKQQLMMKSKFISLRSIIVSLLLVIQFGCGTSTDTKYTDTPTSGNVTISADETLKPIIDSEIMVFQSLYKNAHVKVRYQSEADCFKDLMADSSSVIIVARKLSTDEKKIFNEQKYFPTETSIAKDAIAIIVNNSNKDTLLTYAQLSEILKGNIDSWKGVSSNSSLKNIQIVFDNANSSTLRLIKDSILHTNQLPKNIFATKTNEEVIDYVNKNENAIGIIGVNWCKDIEAKDPLAFTSKVKIVGIDPIKKVEVDFPQPLQSYIYSGFYPLTRTIYSISREAHAGLGTGFVSFLASDKGQRIILKRGLVPSTMPIRIVHLKNNI
jgi:phosphate transport system substrate-binding protein